MALSGDDGQIRRLGAQGLFSGDLRVLARAELTVNGDEPEPIGWTMHGADSAEFTGVLRRPEDPTPDPASWVRRQRVVRNSGMEEVLLLENASDRDLPVQVRLRFEADLADMEIVKAGRAAASVRPVHSDAGAGAGVQFAGRSVTATLACCDAEVEIIGYEVDVAWVWVIPPRSRKEFRWSILVADTAAAVYGADDMGGFRAPFLSADDRRLPLLVARSVSDLRSLRMTTPATPDSDFLAAGSPWYLTLFGRDSIWAARMLLPLGTGLAAGTLRTLAHRQGTIENVDSAEEPGKILHEMRRAVAGADSFLPPVYYGTVDATPLWVCLLADAWRWGMPPAEVEALLPAMERALEWMTAHGDSDGDGFLEYIDRSGRGLTNQGWKDSGDSVRFADGRIAAGPVALAEVQSYAFEAAVAGADLLDAFGRAGGGKWRDYAAALGGRFRERFWAADDLGAYPVLALDGRKTPVDAPASNMGHLLHSGILTAAEAALVADRLVHPSMSSGFGLRTMSSTAGGYSPLSYHCGSVWPHDTAIAVHGLLRAGFPAHAVTLANGLLAASAAFDGRLPELFGGFSADEMPVPVPYPASCRPQAWSAASAIVLLQTYLGLTADVPRGCATISPPVGPGAISVAGLQIAGSELAIGVDAGGEVISAATDADVTIRTD